MAILDSKKQRVKYVLTEIKFGEIDSNLNF